MPVALSERSQVCFPHAAGERGERRVDFCVIGVQKSGTTALHAFLSEHPAVRMADEKEVHFFDADVYFAGRAPDYDAYHARFPRPAKRQLLGETTPMYLFWPGALERIATYNPAMRLIVIFRDPVARAYSHWRMSRAHGREDLGFSAAIREGRDRLEGRDDFAMRNFTYVERGFYGAQVQRLMRLFPAEQLHFLRMDDLRDRHDETLRRVFRFLGLPDARVSPRRVFAAGDGSERAAISATDAAHLDALYDEDLQQFSALTGLDIDDWR